VTGLVDLARALERSPGIEVGNLIVADSVDSTNTLARRVVDEAWNTLEAGPQALIVALEQTAGRGRQGRSWVSRRGLGIYATLLLAVEEAALQTLPLLVGVGLARALDGIGCPARLKWPNDLQVEGRKLGGILIESISRDGWLAPRMVDTTQAGRVSPAPRTARAATIIGFGVNHGHATTELPTPISTSLRQVLDPLPPFEVVTVDLVRSVLKEVGRAGDAEYARHAYQAWTVHRAGDTVRCRVAQQDLEGVFLGFDERGFLRLEVAGSERRVASGEIVE